MLFKPLFLGVLYPLLMGMNSISLLNFTDGQKCIVGDFSKEIKSAYTDIDHGLFRNKLSCKII